MPTVSPDHPPPRHAAGSALPSQPPDLAHTPCVPACPTLMDVDEAAEWIQAEEEEAAALALAQKEKEAKGSRKRARQQQQQGCNLSVHRKSERLHFFDLQAFPGETSGSGIADSLAQLYNRIRRVVEANRAKESAGRFTVMIDDVSLLEVAANGLADDVLDFLHYCVTLTSEMNCSLVVLVHEDIYSSEDGVGLLLHLRYIADLVIRAVPLSTGLAADLHGQLSVVNKGMMLSEQRLAKGQKVWNFHFKVKENGAEFFYPGSRH